MSSQRMQAFENHSPPQYESHVIGEPDRANGRIDGHGDSSKSEKRVPFAGYNRVRDGGDELDLLVSNLRVSAIATSQIVLQPGEAIAIAPVDSHAIYCVLTGEGQATAGKKSTDLRRGSTIMEPCLRDLAFQASENCGAFRVVRLIIDVHLAQRPQFLEWLAAPIYDHDDTTLKLEAFMTILGCIEGQRVGATAIADALLKAVFIGMLMRTIDREALDGRFMTSITQPGVARVVNHVADFPAKQHTVENMALLAGVTPSELSVRFHRIFGLSPADYVKQVRLRCAESLLNDTELPVKTIAGMVGFGSRSHFSRIFSEHTGLDPTAFRHRTKNASINIHDPSGWAA